MSSFVGSVVSQSLVILSRTLSTTLEMEMKFKRLGKVQDKSVICTVRKGGWCNWRRFNLGWGLIQPAWTWPLAAVIWMTLNSYQDNYKHQIRSNGEAHTLKLWKLREQFDILVYLMLRNAVLISPNMRSFLTPVQNHFDEYKERKITVTCQLQTTEPSILWIYKYLVCIKREGVVFQAKKEAMWLECRH